MRLKLDLNLMEHYERHCPQPERRYNCLVPPPKGYKVFANLLGQFHILKTSDYQIPVQKHD
jgi:Putative S-adenosyl-L-methionine-dependent methyltransferase